MQFDDFNNINWKKIKGKLIHNKFVSAGRKQGKVLDLSLSFDTETTSYKDENEEKFAFMYVWQFGIDGYYCYGRTWKQFKQLLKFISDTLHLNKDKRVIIYIHNLSFEFQFFRKYFKWFNVFATDNRNPIKAITTDGIEFRDSLILSGYSLAKTAENLTSHKIPKMVGDLDYSLIRNSKTKFTKKELGYMLNDVRILIAYIDEQRKQYGNIGKIPLTNTGRVRQLVKGFAFGHGRKDIKKRKDYNELMYNMYLTPELYQQLKNTFMGGFTHANPNYTGQHLHDIASIDFTSSYPTVMISEKYPMGNPHTYKFSDMKDFRELINQKAVIFKVEFRGLMTKIDFDNYLSVSKCKTKNEVQNNGRLYSADYCATYVTDVDFKIIEQCYTWNSINISNIYYWNKEYLPKAIIESILYLYKNKTTLKGVKGKEAEYLHAKGMLNSVYGMTVTDIAHDEIIYDNNGEWLKQLADLREQIIKYNDSKARYLYYPWGVYVTAYARANLWNGILNIRDDYIYTDTDSIKFKNWKKHMNYVKEYNKNILNKLHKAMKYHGLDFKEVEPKTIDGVEKPLGVWDFEGVYSDFKTLGAKRYIYIQDNELHITIAGLSKKKGAEYLKKVGKTTNGIFKLFSNDLTIPKNFSGRMTHTYIDDERIKSITDYQGHAEKVIAKSGVYLEPSEYNMSLSNTYMEFLQYIGNGSVILKFDDYGKAVK